MYHKINAVTPLPDFRLLLHYSDGSAKEYDMKPLLLRTAAFQPLRDVFQACSSKHLLMLVDMAFHGTMTSILMVKSFGRTVLL